MLSLASDHTPVQVPRGYQGEAFMRSGQKVWWTGKVAIGCLAKPTAVDQGLSRDALAIQEALLRNKA